MGDVATGKQLPSFEAHGKAVGAVAFSPDGKLLATASRGENTIKLWALDGGKRPPAQSRHPRRSSVRAPGGSSGRVV